MGWMLAEYVCESGDCERYRFEELQSSPAPAQHPCPDCGAPADRAISAPKPKTQWGVVQRGKSEEKPHPLAQDTSALADGMSMNDWRAQRRKLRADDRRKRVRGMVS